MPNVIDKFAFLLHEPILYGHWKDIWGLLDPDEFQVLLTDEFRKKDGSPFALSAQNLENLLRSHGYPYCYVSDLLESGSKYRYVVSNHLVSGGSLTRGTKRRHRVRRLRRRVRNACFRLIRMKHKVDLLDPQQYVSLQCGVNPIRMMYGADINDGWSLAQWNEQYSVVLCHGPNDAAAVQSRFDAEVFQMGYPRYDRYFNDPIPKERNPLFEEFSLSRERKTIIWLPTMGDAACSIPYYAEHVARLANRFNVIVRPHPISLRDQPDYIQLLEELKFKIDRNDVRDMNSLYALADFVVCDYGGTAFSALYLDKNIVQLNVPGADSWFATSRSSNMELRKLLSPVLDPSEAEQLSEIFEDDGIWQRQKAQREKAFQSYFAPYRGDSSVRVVQLLRDLRDGRIGRNAQAPVRTAAMNSS